MSGDTLKLIRQFHNIKQSKLASDIKVSSSYLSEIESGDKKVTLELLKKYSDYFNIPMSSLMMFSEKVESGSISENFRLSFASKLKQMMEWLVAKDDHSGAH